MKNQNKTSSLKPIPKPRIAKRDSAIDFHHLFDISPQPIILYDQNSLRILDANQAALGEYGYSRSEFLELSMEDIHPDGNIYEHERKDGSKMSVHMVNKIIPYRDKEVCAAFISKTEGGRSSSGANLEPGWQNSNQRFRQLVESSNVIAWEADAETGIFIYVNPQAEQIMGYTVDEWYQPTFWQDHIHPDDREWVVAYCIESCKTKSDYEFEYRMLAKDGRVVLLRDIVNVAVNAEGRKILRGYMFDITDRKKAENELRISEERYRLAAKATNDIIWDWDLKAEKVQFSEALKNLGYSGLTETTTVWWKERLHPDDCHRVIDGLNAIIEQPSSETWYDEYRFRQADGSYASIFDRGYVVRNSEGQAIRMIGAMFDLTERNRSKQMLQEQNELLETLNHIGTTLTAELEPNKLVQALTDAATKVSGAEIGAFFYNVVDPAGDSYMLYTLSGVSPSAFDKFPMPRNTDVFGPTFRGEGVVRSDNITQDPRYGNNFPYAGMPKGHFPVVSYMAVPVVSKSGKVLGGLFFGHSKPGIFTENAEKLVCGIASQAAIALDNAQLYSSLRESELRFRQLADAMPQMVWTANADGYVDYFNKQWFEYTGKAEGLEQNWQSAIHPDDMKNSVDTYFNCVAKGMTCEMEHRFKGKDGSYRWFFARSVPVKDAEGRIVRWIGTNTDIQSIKEANQALKESQTRYESLVLASAQVVWQTREDGTVVEDLPTWRAFTGQSVEELLSPGGWMKMIHPEDVEKCLRVWKHSLANQSPHENEFRIKRFDGVYRTVYARAVPIFTENGQLKEWIGTLTDVTEKHQAQEALRFREQQLSIVTDNLPVLISYIDKTLHYRFVNQQYENWFGVKREEIVGRHMQDVQGAEVYEALGEKMDAVLSGTEINAESWLDYKFVGKRYVHLNYLPHYNDRREVEGFFALISDETDRKHAEQRLRTQYGVSQALASSLSINDAIEKILEVIGQNLSWDFCGFWNYDKSSDRLVFFNSWQSLDAACEKFLTASKETSFVKGEGLPGRVWANRTAECIPTLCKDSNFPRYFAAENCGLVTGCAFPIIFGDDPIGVVEVYAKRPVETGEAVISMMNTIGNEIGQFIQRRLAEQEVGRLNNDLLAKAHELERSNKELEQFAYVASHDLKEPLRVVAGFAQLLGKRYKGKLDPTADEFIGHMLDGLTRMQRLIDGLLTYSRLGKKGMPFKSFDSGHACNQAIANLYVSIKESNAQVTRDVLPRIIGDEMQFIQLFQNLIANAIKFRTPERQPRIHIGVRREGKEWIYSVADNGIGIKEEYFERVFDIFRRLHSYSEYPGTGVGLAICKKIVERHGGRIWIQSNPGEGSTFFFSLPVTEEG